MKKLAFLCMIRRLFVVHNIKILQVPCKKFTIKVIESNPAIPIDTQCYYFQRNKRCKALDISRAKIILYVKISIENFPKLSYQS